MGVWELVLATCIMTTVIKAVSCKPVTESKEYLEKYGYLDPESEDSEEAVIQAVLDFQEFTGLEKTGIMDSATEEMMEKPRCGISDAETRRHSRRTRKRRYALRGGSWEVQKLKYKVAKKTKKRTWELDEFQRAADQWSHYTPFNITRTKKKNHFEMFFASGNHGDSSPFDGPGGTLAHAFFPSSGGDIHFDKDETWTQEGNEGINFYQVALHELGHTLGLDHSDVQPSIMWPFYEGYDPDAKLEQDDIDGIHALYGPVP